MDASQDSITTPAEQTDLVGQVLAGRYRILKKLGEGAMGAVYLGEHVRMGRKDAIKVLRGPLASDAEAIRRFTRGARNVSAVHHPNVCTVYDFSDTAEGITFLAMELITGDSLRELMEREGALPPERAVAIARQTADALEAAHEAGIVHRDLKPANIMLMQDRAGRDVVKVVDFDIAKGQEEVEGSEVTRVGFVVGTPEYMSPEQLMGEKLDGRSDLYSLGLVLFRMLTGSLPFRAATTQELMVQRLTHTPLRLDEALPGRSFPPALQAAIARALSRQPDARQASAAEFGREIVAALSPSPPAQQPAPAAAVPATIIAPAPGPATGSTGIGTAPLTPLELAATAAAPAAGTGSLAGGGRPRPIIPIIAVLALLLLGGGGTAVWWFTRQPTRVAEHRPPDSGQSDGNTSTPATSSTTTTPATEPPATTSTVAAGAEDGASTTSPATSTPAVSQPEPAGEKPRAPSGLRVDGARVARALSPAGAHDVLWRQFDRLGPPYPARGQLMAIRDTARSYWQLDGVGDKERALAAFILGNTYIATGDRSQIVPWLQRAVSLDPAGPGYRKLLDYYRGQQ